MIKAPALPKVPIRSWRPSGGDYIGGVQVNSRVMLGS